MTTSKTRLIMGYTEFVTITNIWVLQPNVGNKVGIPT